MYVLSTADRSRQSIIKKKKKSLQAKGFTLIIQTVLLRHNKVDNSMWEGMRRVGNFIKPCVMRHLCSFDIYLTVLP